MSRFLRFFAIALAGCMLSAQAYEGLDTLPDDSDYRYLAYYPAYRATYQDSFDDTEWEVEAVKDTARLLWGIARSMGYTVSQLVERLTKSVEPDVIEIVDGSCCIEPYPVNQLPKFNNDLKRSPKKNKKRLRKS